MKIGNRSIGPDHPPYIIAELCNNFNGDYARAKYMVYAAKAAGVDAVKFQLRFLPGRLTPEEHASMASFCRATDITWLCTAYDQRGLDVLREIDPPAYKIGSAEVVNEAFVKAVFDQVNGKPVLVSIGAATLDVLNYLPCNAILMQCTSIYPTPYDKVNLGVLHRIRHYRTYCGLSCHTPTIWTSIGAVALGASVIEKHFTLDRIQPGPDQSSSITPDEMAELVQASKAVWQARGTEKTVYPEELEKMKAFRP